MRSLALHVLVLLLAGCHPRASQPDVTVPRDPGPPSEASATLGASQPGMTASPDPRPPTEPVAAAGASPVGGTPGSLEPAPSGSTAQVTIRCDDRNIFAWLVPANSSQHEQSQLLARGHSDAGTLGALTPVPQPGGPNAGAAKCEGGVTFTRAPGEWLLGLDLDGGWAKMYEGPRKTLRLKAGESLHLSFTAGDFKLLGECCHCPFVSVYDPALGRDRPAFEVLGDRADASKMGTDRYTLSVPVRQHAIVLHLREIEREISFVDSVYMETPRAVVMMPLSRPPKILREGEEVTLHFVHPDVVDGDADVTLVVSGHYEIVPP